MAIANVDIRYLIREVSSTSLNKAVIRHKKSLKQINQRLHISDVFRHDREIMLTSFASQR